MKKFIAVALLMLGATLASAEDVKILSYTNDVITVERGGSTYSAPCYETDTTKMSDLRSWPINDMDHIPSTKQSNCDLAKELVGKKFPMQCDKRHPVCIGQAQDNFISICLRFQDVLVSIEFFKKK